MTLFGGLIRRIVHQGGTHSMDDESHKKHTFDDFHQVAHYSVD